MGPLHSLDSANACGAHSEIIPNADQFKFSKPFVVEEWVHITNSIDWEDYRTWLLRNKQKTYASGLFRLTKRTYQLAFTNDLVLMENSRKKEDILRAIANLSRYLDIRYDTYLHEKFLYWLKRKEVKWKTTRNSNLNYVLANNVSLEKIVENIEKLPYKYRIFALFVLVSGLRTGEALNAFNNHSKLCNGEMIEMFWDRKTKKANAVYCHPILHAKIDYTLSANMLHRNLHSKIIGCQIRYLRKLNFTMVATKIDPLLAEFMQGRRGNISQRHYFLPLMKNNRKKWTKLWQPMINNSNLIGS